MDDTSLDTGLKDTNSDNSVYSDNFFFFALFGTPSFGITAFIKFVATCAIICLGLPLTLGAIYGLCSQVRNGEVAPIYVINLLISDLIQFCCMICEVAQPKDQHLFSEYSEILIIFISMYIFSLLASVGFMVCIALERYLVIVHPLWYRCRRTIKTSVMICVPVWIVPAVFVLIQHFIDDNSIFIVIYTIFLLLPLPLLLFFMVATLEALSASISVSTDEKRRIARMLILVLLIYLLLFLPSIIMFVYIYIPFSYPPLLILYDLAPMFFKLSPLADLVLYIILRKGTVRQLSACVCRCRKQSNETSSVPV